MASKSVYVLPGLCRKSPYSAALPLSLGAFCCTSCRMSGRRVQISLPRGRKSRPTCVCSMSRGG
jgi:hypothetical protein